MKLSSLEINHLIGDPIFLDRSFIINGYYIHSLKKTEGEKTENENH